MPTISKQEGQYLLQAIKRRYNKPMPTGAYVGNYQGLSNHISDAINLPNAVGTTILRDVTYYVPRGEKNSFQDNSTNTIYNYISEGKYNRASFVHQFSDDFEQHLQKDPLQTPLQEELDRQHFAQENSTRAQQLEKTNEQLAEALEETEKKYTSLEKLRQKHLRLLYLAAILVGLLLVAFFLRERFLAQKKVEWKMATTWDGKSSYISEALRDFENRIEQRTKGQFKITIKNSLEHPTTGVSIKFDSLCNLLTSDQEDLQIIHAGNYYWKDWRGRLPESTFFAAIPFGRDYEKMDDWMGERADEWTDSTKWKMGYRFWHNLYAPYGIVPFPGGNSGRQWGGWYKQPITRIEDYKGKKIRISNVGQMIMEAVGGNTCTLKQYQIKDSMQFGKLDMAEWINCYDDQKMGMDKCGFRYVETEGWAEPSSLFGFFVNEKALNSLEPNIKAILLDEIEHLNSKMKGIFEHRHYDALRTLKEENNTRLPKDKLVFFELPKPVRTVLKDSTKAILSRYVQQRKVGHPTIEAIYKSYIEGCPELK